MIDKFDVIKYFEYYRKHTFYVILAWKDIQDILIEKNIITEDEFNKINRLIVWHDNSKISKEEFDAYGIKFYPINKTADDKTLEEVKIAFKAAWEHHKMENLHHHQSLKEYKNSDWKCYLIEMICDWIAMGWETGVFAFEYYEKNKDNIDLPLEYKIFLEKVINLIKKEKCYSNKMISSSEEIKLTLK